ncbi:MAG: STAS-like domain-containing protein [Bacillota bacterium]|nr:STAS-like domain-containing protein [Bacillota bacterium]
MNYVIRIREVLGENLICEDALIIKRDLMNHLNDSVVLDFTGTKDVPTTFFYTLFSDLLYSDNRSYIFNNVKVKNLSNLNDYNKVVTGTFS